MARVRLERPTARAATEFLAAVARSGKLHTPWVAPPRTESAYRAYVKRARTPTHVGYLIRLRDAGELSALRISARSCAALSAALTSAITPSRRIIGQAFRRLRLHRVEANIQPANRASLRLVRRLGFRREGYSPRYLKVRGRWRDHERWALLAAE